MARPPDNLATRLADQRSERLYRLRRQVRQFSHRFRGAAIVAATFTFLLLYVSNILAGRWHIEGLDLVIRPLFILTLGYLATLPLVFTWRTGLTGYLLQEHWLWLAIWFALPLDYFVLRIHFGTRQWLPVAFLAAITVGQLLRSQRETHFEGELERQEKLWHLLLPLGVIDLVLWGFWGKRRLLDT